MNRQLKKKSFYARYNPYRTDVRIVVGHPYKDIINVYHDYEIGCVISCYNTPTDITKAKKELTCLSRNRNWGKKLLKTGKAYKNKKYKYYLSKFLKGQK